jgi:hypothetical protein
MMEEKWIYKTLTLDWVNPGKVDEKLNELGKKGWEAIGLGVASNMAGMATRHIVLFKKRFLESEHSAKQAEQAEQAAMAAEKAAKDIRTTRQSCRYCKKPFLKSLEACPNCFPEN